MSELPEWITKHTQDARDLFGVGGAEWHIFVSLNDRPKGSDDYSGSCKPDYVYLDASIELSRILEDNREGKETIYHEIMHVAMSEIDHIMTNIIANADEDMQAVWSGMFQDAVERFIQRTVRNLLERVEEKG